MINFRNFIYCLFFVFCLFFTEQLNANAVDYRYQKAFKVQRLSLTDGLSQSVVQDIIQDQQGYVWIATEDGLNRFDSYNFEIFRHDHRNKNSLHYNWVLSLVEEPGYGIWVGTYVGLSFYNPNNQSFTNYSLENQDLRSSINEFVYSREGVVWIATDNGLFWVDRDQDAVKPFIASDGLKVDEEIEAITESKEFLFLASSQCIIQINKLTSEKINMCDRESLAVLEDKFLSAIIAKDNTLWIGTSTGLYRYEILKDKLISYKHSGNNRNSLNSNNVKDLVFDANGGLWIATTGGLDYYDPQKEIFEHYSQQKFAEDGLSSNDIRSLFVDSEKLVWLGTYGGGFNILDPNQHQFEHILTKTDVQKLGDNNTIHSIEKDQNEILWLGSYGGGLIAYDLLKGDIKRPLDDANFDYDQYVYSLTIDRFNRLWVSSLSEINLIDIKSQEVIPTQFFMDDIKVDSVKNVNKVYEDYLGDIWLVSEQGLYKVKTTEIKENILSIYLEDLTPKLPNSFTRYRTVISSIVADRYGDFWFGGLAGLVRYQPSKDRWEHYTYDSENSRSLSNDSVQVLFEDSQGFLWIGTADGLNRLVRSGQEQKENYFERITTYEGLPNNSIYGILEDEANQLWISTNLGLVRYASNKNLMDLYRSVDGLSSDEFNTGAYFSDQEGRLYFGSINGITVVNSVLEKGKPDNRNLLFTRIQIGKRVINVEAINKLAKPAVVQSKNESSIDIEVANISFNKLGTQRYRYKIVGLDDRWNYLGTRRNMFIAGLQSGDYVLEIQSQLAGHSWNKKIRRLYITVESDFWNSRQAYYLIAISILLVFVSSLYVTARYYIKRINRIKKKVGIESLRLKQIRIDNESLKQLVNKREEELHVSEEKVLEHSRRMIREKHKDTVTGFYRLSFIENLFVEEKKASSTGGATDKYSSPHYIGVAILELDNFVDVYNKLGPIASAELEAGVSNTIRNELNASARVFSLQNGAFLILGNQAKISAFIGEMESLRNRIIISKYDIANGLFESSSVTLTVLELDKNVSVSKNGMLSTIDFLEQIHRQLTTQGRGRFRRITCSSTPKSKSKQESWDLDVLVLNNDIQIEEI